jgi:hypothetical protein
MRTTTRRHSSTNGVIVSSSMRARSRHLWLLLSTMGSSIPSGTVFGFVVLQQSPRSPQQSCRGSAVSTTRRFLAAPQPPVQDETRDATTTTSSSRLPLADLSKEQRALFDPFDIRSMDKLDIAAQITDAKTDDQTELGIWAARGLLLLVAAIWGTNFAVRSGPKVPAALCAAQQDRDCLSHANASSCFLLSSVYI